MQKLKAVKNAVCSPAETLLGSRLTNKKDNTEICKNLPATLLANYRGCLCRSSMCHALMPRCLHHSLCKSLFTGVIRDHYLIKRKRIKNYLYVPYSPTQSSGNLSHHFIEAFKPPEQEWCGVEWAVLLEVRWRQWIVRQKKKAITMTAIPIAAMPCTNCFFFKILIKRIQNMFQYYMGATDILQQGWQVMLTKTGRVNVGVPPRFRVNVSQQY